MRTGPDTYAHRGPQQRWWRYDITVSSPDGTWHWQESDPIEALTKARTQLFTPAVGDAFNEATDIPRLHNGETLRAICQDGAVVAVTPLLI